LGNIFILIFWKQIPRHYSKYGGKNTSDSIKEEKRKYLNKISRARAVHRSIPLPGLIHYQVNDLRSLQSLSQFGHVPLGHVSVRRHTDTMGQNMDLTCMLAKRSGSIRKVKYVPS
jgi:hypothetical protein